MHNTMQAPQTGHPLPQHTAPRWPAATTEGSMQWLLAMLAMLARRRNRLQPRHYTS